MRGGRTATPRHNAACLSYIKAGHLRDRKSGGRAYNYYFSTTVPESSQTKFHIIYIFYKVVVYQFGLFSMYCPETINKCFVSSQTISNIPGTSGDSFQNISFKALSVSGIKVYDSENTHTHDTNSLKSSDSLEYMDNSIIWN